MAIEKLLRLDPITNDPKLFNSATECLGAKQLVSNETVNAPFIVSSTAVVTSLNSDQVDGVDVNDGATPSNTTLWTSAKVADYIADVIEGFSWQLPVISDTVTAPPANPNNGDRYIVPSGATGSWSGKTNMIAHWESPAWTFTNPIKGFAVYVDSLNANKVFNGTVWVGLGGIGNHESLTGLLGGDNTNGHWHLTQQERLDVQKMSTSIGTNSIDHEKLENLCGGVTGEHYHASQAQHNAVFGGPAIDASLYHTHSNLATCTAVTNGLGGKADCNHTHAFTDLSDTPTSLTGVAGCAIIVNNTGDALVFGNPGSDGKIKGDQTDGSLDYLCSKIDISSLSYNSTTHSIGVKNGVFASVNHNHDTLYYTQSCLAASNGNLINWNNICNTPTNYPPSSHTHPITDIENMYSPAGKNGNFLMTCCTNSGAIVYDWIPITDSDEYVKMNASDTAGYLDSKIDNQTIGTDGNNQLCVICTNLDNRYYTQICLTTPGSETLINCNKIYGYDHNTFGYQVKANSSDSTADYLDGKINPNQLHINANNQIEILSNFLNNCHLTDLNDVNISSFSGDGYYLKYDNNNQQWINSKILMSDVELTGMTNVIYVSDIDGDDLNSGTPLQPFKTISAAAAYLTSNAIASAILMLAPGTYVEDVALPNGVSLFGSGVHRTIIDGDITTGTSPLTLKDFSHNNGTITIQSTTNASKVFSTGTVTTNSDLTANDFTIHSTTGVALTVSGGLVAIMNSTISASDSNAINHTGGQLVLNSAKIQNNSSSAETINSSGNSSSEMFIQIMNSSVRNIYNSLTKKSITIDNNTNITKPNALLSIIYDGKININSGDTFIDNDNGLEVADINASPSIIRQTSSKFINDSSINGDTITDALETLNAGKANTVSGTSGNFASLDGSGDLVDSAYSVNDTTTSVTTLWTSCKIDGELNVSNLRDTNITSVSNKDMLKYNGTAWVNVQANTDNIADSSNYNTDLNTGSLTNTFNHIKDIEDALPTTYIQLDGTNISADLSINTKSLIDVDELKFCNGSCLLSGTVDSDGKVIGSEVTFNNCNTSLTSTDVQAAISELDINKVNIINGTSGNFASLDGSGNLMDSTYSVNDTSSASNTLWTSCKIDGELNVSNLRDTNITSVLNEDMLKYDSTTSKWVNVQANTDNIADNSNYNNDLNTGSLTNTFNHIKDIEDALPTTYIQLGGGNIGEDLSLQNHSLTHISDLQFGSGTKLIDTTVDSDGKVIGSEVTFNNGNTSLTSTDVQAAISELDDKKANHAYNDQYDLYDMNTNYTASIGDVVTLVKDTNDNNIKIDKASAIESDNKYQVIGIVSGLIGSKAKVQSVGKLSGVNISGGSFKDNLYLSSATPGQLTTTPPSNSGEMVIPLGFITDDNGSEIFINLGSPVSIN